MDEAASVGNNRVTTREPHPNDEAPMTSIHQARTNVQRSIREVMAIADGAAPTSAASVEQRVWSGLLGLGRALMALYFARQAARWASRSYRVEEHDFTIVGT